MKTAQLLALAPVIAAGAGFLIPSLLQRNGRRKSPDVTKFVTNVPWLGIEGDEKTVKADYDRYFRVIELKGALSAAASQQQQELLEQQRYLWMLDRRLKPVNVRTLSRRRRIAVDMHGTPFNPEYAEAHRRWSAALSRGYQVKHYLILTVEGRGKLDALDEAERAFTTKFVDDHAPRVLTNLKTADGSATLPTFLSSLINVEDLPVPPAVSDRPLADQLIRSHLTLTGDGSFLWEGIGKPQYAAAVSIKDYSEQITDSIVKSIMATDAELDFMVHAEPWEPTKAETFVVWRAAQQKFRFLNHDIQRQFSDARDDITKEADTIVTTECNIMVRADDPKTLNKKCEDLISALDSKHKVKAIRERAFAESVFWSFIPGFTYFTRGRTLSCKNWADLTPLQGAPTGHTHTVWGKGPSRYFPNATIRSPFALSLHPGESDEGSPHSLIFAGTGRGKSVFASFLIDGALTAHENLRAIAFDRNRGLAVQTDFADGQYVFPGRSELPLNPFDVADTPTTRQQLERFLAMLAEKNDDESLKHISTGVADIMALPRQLRIMRDILDSVFPPGAVKSALTKWAKSQRYGNIFNGKYDAFDPQAKRLTTIGMDEVISDDRLSVALTRYLMTRIRTAFAENGTPYLIFVDECNILLNDPGMVDLVGPEVVTARKNLGVLLFAWQNVSVLKSSPLADTLMKNCSNFFFWPGTASDEEELKGFSLTEAEKEFVLGRAMPQNSFRPILFKRKDGEGVFIDTDLSALGEYVGLYRSNPVMHNRLLKYRQRYGENWRHAYLTMPDIEL